MSDSDQRLYLPQQHVRRGVAGYHDPEGRITVVDESNRQANTDDAREREAQRTRQDRGDATARPVVVAGTSADATSTGDAGNAATSTGSDASDAKTSTKVGKPSK